MDAQARCCGLPEQLAGRIFEWRGLIAHGKKILEKFREPIDFEFGPKELEYLRVEDWTEEALLAEARSSALSRHCGRSSSTG